MSDINSYIIKHYVELDSTQFEAKRFIVNYPGIKTAIILADNQMSGVGRYRRIWHSSDGDILFTMIIYPRHKVQMWYQISYIVAVAVGESILRNFSFYNLKLNYGWVNDILIDEQKIAGILLENYNNFALLVGVGINVVDKELILNYRRKPISFSNLGVFLDKQKLIAYILNYFFYILEIWEFSGFVPIRKMWLKYAHSLNSNIKIRFFNKEVSGIFLDIDNDGRLLLLDTHNSLRIICVGEIWDF